MRATSCILSRSQRAVNDGLQGYSPPPAAWKMPTGPVVDEQRVGTETPDGVSAQRAQWQRIL